LSNNVTQLRQRHPVHERRLPPRQPCYLLDVRLGDARALAFYLIERMAGWTAGGRSMGADAKTSPFALSPTRHSPAHTKRQKLFTMTPPVIDLFALYCQLSALTSHKCRRQQHSYFSPPLFSYCETAKIARCHIRYHVVCVTEPLTCNHQIHATNTTFNSCFQNYCYFNLNP
jgi:hypothetical protein